MTISEEEKEKQPFRTFFHYQLPLLFPQSLPQVTSADSCYFNRLTLAIYDRVFPLVQNFGTFDVSRPLIGVFSSLVFTYLLGIYFIVFICRDNWSSGEIPQSDVCRHPYEIFLNVTSSYCFFFL